VQLGREVVRGEEVATREGATLRSPRKALSILEMSLVEANLTRGVLAFARIPIGAGGNPEQPKGCANGRLKGGVYAKRKRIIQERGKVN